jgi:D-alanine-D-alanine ligase
MAEVKKKKNIAIAAGGDSGEREISLGSAAVIRKHIDTRRFDPYVILISKEKWVYVTDSGKEIAVDKNDFSLRIKGKKICFDAVFIAIHGTPGEDGRLQAYFDLLGLPYTTCGQVTSALTFNKGFCNKVVANIGVKTARSMHLFKAHIPKTEQILKELKLPLFVKPNNGGSSVGMSKVNEGEKLQAAIRKALKEDPEVLIEEYIKGTEITCGVFKHKGSLTVFPITEIVSQTEYFDWAAKYRGKSQEITPARISEEAEVLCKTTSAMLYEKLNCQGVVRFDYILSKKALYFLEVNTVPGLSELSIVPQQAQVFGYSIKEFFSLLIEDALWRAKK